MEQLQINFPSPVEALTARLAANYKIARERYWCEGTRQMEVRFTVRGPNLSAWSHSLAGALRYPLRSALWVTYGLDISHRFWDMPEWAKEICRNSKSVRDIARATLAVRR